MENIEELKQLSQEELNRIFSDMSISEVVALIDKLNEVSKDE